MPLSPGDRLGSYEILAPLGAGGMGQVYRGRDTKLNRDVAIKVLPPALANDAQYMARFEREAQTLAALNHPNIATLYGIEQGALVMELVEGADLHGPMAVEEVIPIARQIAEGLESAHERGIIHRDLKPANIKLTPAGVVKILDFGLAKSAGEFSAAAAGASPTISPTLSIALTGAGAILGTAAYMSPEQARGKPVDKRTDIWAFGVVLYELLTGVRLFGGDTVTDTIAAVMTREPDWDALPANTPPHVRRLIERCLRRDPMRRLRDIGEARVLLDEPGVPPSVPATASHPRLPWALAAIFALCALTLAALWLRPRPAPPSPGAVRFLIPLPPGTALPRNGQNSTQWTLSPDGRSLAMIVEDISTGKNMIWVRPLGATLAYRLENTDEALHPFWSPDGQFIAFFASGKLKRVALSDRGVTTVCQLSGALRRLLGYGGYGGAWGQDGVIVYGASASPLMRVNATGGIPQPATTLSEDEKSHASPQILPDGRHVLYFSENKDPANNAIYVQELGSAKRVRVLSNMTRAMWSPPGYLLFVRDGTLFAQRMASETFQVEGEARMVAQDVAANDANGRSTFFVSGNGVLAYRSGAPVQTTQLTWRGRDGKILGTLGAPGKIVAPSLSPDGKSLAVVVGDVEMDVWVFDLATGVRSRMTHDSTAPLYYRPLVWSPDSQRLAVTQTHLGIEEIALASGQVRPLSKERISAEAWSPDGETILCSSESSLSLLPLADAAKLRNIPGPLTGGPYRLSPDGKFVLYTSAESGSTEVFVASFPSFAVKRKISSGGGGVPLWANGGKELFYRSREGWMMNAEIHAGAQIEVSAAKQLFKFGAGSALANTFAVNADATRFLTNEAVSSDAEKPAITLVLNWAADMKP